MKFIFFSRPIESGGHTPRPDGLAFVSPNPGPTSCEKTCNCPSGLGACQERSESARRGVTAAPVEHPDLAPAPPCPHLLTRGDSSLGWAGRGGLRGEGSGRAQRSRAQSPELPAPPSPWEAGAPSCRPLPTSPRRQEEGDVCSFQSTGCRCAGEGDWRPCSTVLLSRAPHINYRPQLQTRRRVLTCLPFPNFGLLCSRSVGEACSFHPKMTSRSISGSARCRQTGCLSR